MRERLRVGTDGKIVALLLGLVAITRLPLRTTMLYNWDSANFALALQTFDVTKHSPHPPGYFFYVSLGKLIDAVLHDANASFVLESVLFSAMAVIALYYLGKIMFDRTTGLVAALLLVFSVTFWSYGTVALPYVSLAFFSTFAAFLAFGIIFHGRSQHLLLALVYSIGSGFRPDLLLFLAPLWLYSLHGQRPGRIAAALVVAFGGFVSWFLPTILLSGGLSQYLATFAAYTSVDVMEKYSVMQNGLAALVVNVRDTLSYIFYGLYATAAVLLIGVAAHLVHRLASAGPEFGGKRPWFTGREAFIAGWIAPMALFYVWIHVGDPGYVFTMLPALLILAARSITRMAALTMALTSNRLCWSVAVATISVVVLTANTAVFFLHPRQLTFQGVSQNDRVIASKISYVRENYRPDTAVLISYDLYRHLMYYLPEYDSLWLDVYGRGAAEKRLRPQVEQIILVDERLGALSSGAQQIALHYGKLNRISVRSGARIVYSGDSILVE